MNSVSLLRSFITFALLISVVVAHGAQVDYFLKITGINGESTQGRIVGQQLMLVGEDGKQRPAPDGQYRSGDGRMIIIVGGKIAPGTQQNVKTSKTKPSPSETRALNPQPLPPKSTAKPSSAGINTTVPKTDVHNKKMGTLF